MLNFCKKRLKDKVHYQKFNNMISAIKKIKIDFKKEQMSNEKIILFSPASASFDDFKISRIEENISIIS